MPSAAMREAFLAEAAMPFSRSHSIALSISPSEAVRAFLQSIMPAPVISRRFFNICSSKSHFLFLQDSVFSFEGDIKGAA
jgi:hypothetical protein